MVMVVVMVMLPGLPFTALAVQYSDVGVKILRFGKYKTVY